MIMQLFIHRQCLLHKKEKKKVIKYLSSAVEIFKERNFHYTDNIVTDNIRFYAEFKASFNKIEVNGIDFIKCENNLIKEFKVFLRPVKGIEVVWKEMKNKLVQYDSNLSQQQVFKIKTMPRFN